MSTPTLEAVSPASIDIGKEREKGRNEHFEGVLTSMRGCPAFEIWTRQQWIALAFHLQNGNPPDRWVMGFFAPNFRNAGRPEVQYRRSKKPATIGISWAWTSLCGKGERKIAFTPYSQNADGKSRWAAVDFDSHSDDPMAAQETFRRAFSLFISVLGEEDLHLILEASGRGWHLFLISKEFHPVRYWINLMMTKLKEIGLADQIEQGVIEIFPRLAVNENECGFALRAPGSWNPKTNEPNQILWENVKPLMDELVSLNIANRKAVSRKRKKYVLLAPSSSFSEEPAFLYPRLVKLLGKFGIKVPGTRNKRLGKLVGELFHQVGVEMAERFIVEQYEKKQSPTQATKEAHLEEFGALWAGLHRRWLQTLNEKEGKKYETLENENERDAFRIIHSYAKHSREKGGPDFAIARDDLAGRLGITGPGAGALIIRLLERGIVSRVRNYVPHKFAARYAWRLEGMK